MKVHYMTKIFFIQPFLEGIIFAFIYIPWKSRKVTYNPIILIFFGGLTLFIFFTTSSLKPMLFVRLPFVPNQICRVLYCLHCLIRYFLSI
jgi:hypothetical protein